MRWLIERYVQIERLEHMPVAMHVVTVDVLSGEELRLSDGPTVEAVLASASIPALLRPVPLQGRELMGGDATKNSPISHAIELGAREIYVLPTGHACALQESPHGALAMALHAVSLPTQRRLADDVERHRGEVRLVVLPPFCPLAIRRSTSPTPSS